MSVDGRALVVRPFDQNDTHAIEKAISESDLGLTTQAAKTVIRVPVPTLSQDRREELARAAKGLAEEARVAMRNVRRDALREAARDPSEEGRRRHEEAVESLAKRYLAYVDEAVEAKAADVLGQDDFHFDERKGRRKPRDPAPDPYDDGTIRGYAC